LIGSSFSAQLHQCQTEDRPSESSLKVEFRRLPERKCA